MEKEVVVGVLYIATGKYIEFWKNFYESAKKYFFNESGYRVQFFLFTDMEVSAPAEDVKVNLIKGEKWPMPTLLRYEYFLSEPLLTRTDYLFFFNANTCFLNTCGPNLLPQKSNSLVFVRQPYTLNQKNEQFGYERRPESMAYIPFDRGESYVWGAFNGGLSTDFLKMAVIINKWTRLDLDKSIIARFWDESYLNKYFLDLSAAQYDLIDNAEVYVDGFPYHDDLMQNSAAFEILEKSKYIDVSFKERKKIAISFLSKVKMELKSLLNKK